MRRMLSALLVFAALPLFAADPAQEVRDTETAFAKAFADRDQAKFFSFLAPDSTFVNAVGTLRGKEKVTAAWSPLFATPQPPFSWGPDRVIATPDGKIALSTGPVLNAKGTHIGDYASIWRHEADGTWKIVFDGPGTGVMALPENIIAPEEGVVTTADGGKLPYHKIGRGPIRIIVPSQTLFEPLRQFSEMATIVAYTPRAASTDDLEAVRANFKAEKFVAIGIGDSAPVVAAYAAQHPEHVSRVITFASLADADAKKLTMPLLVVGAKAPEGMTNARAVALTGDTPWTTDPIAFTTAIRHFLRGE